MGSRDRRSRHCDRRRLGISKLSHKRDYLTTVGAAFSAIVDALSDEKLTKQLAAAILLRRFFDRNTELGRKVCPTNQKQ